MEDSDSLLSNSKGPSTVEPIKEQSNGCKALLRRRETMLAERVDTQRQALRRRETFHHQRIQCRPEPQVIQKDILPEIKARRGSFDGLFYVTDVQNTYYGSDSSGKPKQGTRVYIDPKSDLTKKLKSKSLDRIGEGLDSLVDIVVTSEETPQEPVKQQINNSSIVIVSRSPSNRQVREYRPPPRPQKPEETQTKLTPERSVFLPVQRNSSPTDVQKFVLKRGHTNAGLYSGQHNIRDAPGLVPTNRVKTISEYYNKGLSSLNQANLSISMGKLMDLPSGLY